MIFKENIIEGHFDVIQTEKMIFKNCVHANLRNSLSNLFAVFKIIFLLENESNAE